MPLRVRVPSYGRGAGWERELGTEDWVQARPASSPPFCVGDLGRQIPGPACAPAFVHTLKMFEWKCVVGGDWGGRAAARSRAGKLGVASVVEGAAGASRQLVAPPGPCRWGPGGAGLAAPSGRAPGLAASGRGVGRGAAGRNAPEAAGGEALGGAPRVAPQVTPQACRAVAGLLRASRKDAERFSFSTHPSEVFRTYRGEQVPVLTDLTFLTVEERG